MPETSIVKTYDLYSASLKKMSATTKAFEKDIESLEAGLRQLSSNKATLRLDLKAAREELEKAEAGFDGTKEAMQRLSRAQIHVDQITRNLKAVTNASEEMEKSISSAENKAGSGGLFSNLFGSISSLGSNAMWNQWGEMVSKSAGQLVGAGLTSWLGADDGKSASTILNSVFSGASIGMLSGNPLFMAGGAVVGLLTGIVSAGTEVFEKKDDFFKDYYGKLYEGQLSAGAESLTSGSATAGSREQRYRELEKKVGGERAKDYLKQIEEIAAGSTYGYDELLDYVLSNEDPAEALKERRKAAAGSAPSTYEEEKAELADVRTGVETGYGTGYNEERKSALQAITLAFVRVRIPRVF